VILHILLKVNCSKTVLVKKSQNHRMAWVGRDLKDHESPTPLTGRATNLPIYKTRLPRAPSSLALNTSRDGDLLEESLSLLVTFPFQSNVPPEAFLCRQE